MFDFDSVAFSLPFDFELLLSDAADPAGFVFPVIQSTMS